MTLKTCSTNSSNKVNKIKKNPFNSNNSIHKQSSYKMKSKMQKIKLITLKENLSSSKIKSQPQPIVVKM